MQRYAEQLSCQISRGSEVEGKWLADSGYIRLVSDDIIAILDVGSVGPTYIPAHAHADTLSFELSSKIGRIFVNSGISQYGLDNERLRQRSSSAHNTVSIGNHSSSEVWSGFRVARRARIVELRPEVFSDGGIVRAAHDGFVQQCLGGVHTRTWHMANRKLSVVDSLLSRRDKAFASFHLAPGLHFVQDPSGKSGKVCSKDKLILTWKVLCGAPVVQNTTWHQGFGKREEIQKLAIFLDEGKSEIQFIFA